MREDADRLVARINKEVGSAVAEIEAAINGNELNIIRSRYLGYKGAMPSRLAQLRYLEAKDRPPVGQEMNKAISRINEALKAKEESI
jgi:phenylalanyl-tRNA synthetase alpha subunit